VLVPSLRRQPSHMRFLAEHVQAKRKLLTAELNGLVTAWFAHDWPKDEPPPINGDPFANTREYPDRAVIEAVQVNGDVASVRVVFADAYVRRPIEVMLSNVAGTWRIDDLRYEDGTTFRAALAQR
jgi:hypothetical protein